ncbi:MAG: DUF4446 family protein [Bacillota bacterium]
MKDLIPLINDYILWLPLALAIVFFILCVIIWQRNKTIKDLLKFYSTLMDSYEEGNLESILQQVIRKQEDILNQLRVLEGRIENCEGQLPDYINKVALLRYKAFPDVGGDLSFSLALLNQRGTGLVLTGIYGRSETRTYAKEVQFFNSNYPLSEEEQQVIIMAKNRGGSRE